LIKKLQVLAEEIVSFLKLIINLDFYYNYPKIFEKIIDKLIEISFYETNHYFLLDQNKKNLSSININSYVEFYGRIKKISVLKSVNCRINFVCSSCGVIYSRNYEQVRNHKSLNNYFINNQDKEIHCSNKDNFNDNINHKIFKEYSDSKFIKIFQ